MSAQIAHLIRLSQTHSESLVARTDFAVYCCVRNEAVRLPYFLEYYRSLGVKLFVFVDNDSDDGTTDLLLRQDDCVVFWSDQPYSESRCGIDWINQLLGEFEVRRWVLIVDADELLVFPNIEHLSLQTLVTTLERQGVNALPTFLLDMYGSGPLNEIQYSPGEPFLSVCPYFDRTGYTFATTGVFKGLPVRGGPRQRLFWEGRRQVANPPFLAKTPLVKWGPGMSLEASTHVIRGVRPGCLSGVLLHFKMLPDFVEAVSLEAKRKEHWENAGQYVAYRDILYLDSGLDPMYSGSESYKNSRQLVELGLMRGDRELSDSQTGSE